MNGEGGEFGAVPPQPVPGGGGGDGAARSKVAGPAIGLMVTAGIGIFCQIIGILVRLLGLGMSAFGEGDGGGGMMRMFGGTLGLALGAIGIVVGVVIFFGAQKMKALESYSLAMVATILAMIPCISPCCILGLPIGIWALVVLLGQDVKMAFRS